MGRIAPERRFRLMKARLEQKKDIPSNNIVTLKDNLAVALGRHDRKTSTTNWRKAQAQSIMKRIKQENPRGLLPFMLTVGHRQAGDTKFEIDSYLQRTDEYPESLPPTLQHALSQTDAYNETEFEDLILTWKKLAPPLSVGPTYAAHLGGLRSFLGAEAVDAFQRCADFRGVDIAARYTWSHLLEDVCLKSDVLLTDDFCSMIFAGDFSYVSTDRLTIINNSAIVAIEQSQLRMWENRYEPTSKTRCISLREHESDRSVGTISFRLNAAFLNWFNGSSPNQLNLLG